jgi:hypothetical protein
MARPGAPPFIDQFDFGGYREKLGTLVTLIEKGDGHGSVMPLIRLSVIPLFKQGAIS